LKRHAQVSGPRRIDNDRLVLRCLESLQRDRNLELTVIQVRKEEVA
jgi:hypothetical protein